jgi:hypothetical protein
MLARPGGRIGPGYTWCECVGVSCRALGFEVAVGVHGRLFAEDDGKVSHVDTSGSEEAPSDRPAWADAMSEARNTAMRGSVDVANRVLDSITEPTVGWLSAARSVLDRLRERPCSEPLWREFEAESQRLHSAARRGFAGSVDPQDLVHLKDAGKSGTDHALKMAAIVEADAPLCEEHGPMIRIGSDWSCAEDTACANDYWDFDGNRYARQ